MKYLFAFIVFLIAHQSTAAQFPEEAGIYLVDAEKTETRIGNVTFANRSGTDSVAILVEIDSEALSEHFLSMRPFKCLTGSKEWFCYLEYPYDLRSVVTEDDLSDLEYQLLFIKKTPEEFGIDAWNGLYYKLRTESDGTITGELLEGDLNSLQSPPSEKYAKPVELDEFIRADISKRLFPTLRIY